MQQELLVPTLEVSDNGCWIRTYKEVVNPPSNIGVDELYHTDKTTLIDLFFKSDPEVYKKEIKKTTKELELDQESANDCYDFLFQRTKKEMVYLRDYYIKRLAELEKEEALNGRSN